MTETRKKFKNRKALNLNIGQFFVEVQFLAEKSVSKISTIKFAIRGQRAMIIAISLFPLRHLSLNGLLDQ